MLSNGHFWWLPSCTAQQQANRQLLHLVTELECTGNHIHRGWKLRPNVWWRLVHILCLKMLPANTMEALQEATLQADGSGPLSWPQPLLTTHVVAVGLLLDVAGNRKCWEECHDAGRVAVQASHGHIDASCLFSHALHETLPLLADRRCVYLQVREYLEKHYQELSGMEAVKMAIKALTETVEAGSKNIEVCPGCQQLACICTWPCQLLQQLVHAP